MRKNDILDYTYDELLFKLGLYSKVKVDFSTFENHTRQEDVDFNYTETVYITKYSKSFKYLIGFIQKNNNMFEHCPQCTRTLSLRITGNELDDELINPIVEWYYESQIDEDTQDLSEYNMEKKIDLLLQKYKYFEKETICTHNTNHQGKFIYYLYRPKKEEQFIYLVKVGQYPSISDLLPQPNEYKKVLDDKILNELNTAKYLYSYGVGIGSFVYIRRIFEKLVHDAYLEARCYENWDEEQYKKKRSMSKKIEFLKDYLPEEIVTYSKIYDILSKGVHQLEEDECNNIFNVVLNGIEIILNAKIKKLQEEKKRKELDKNIQQVLKQHS